MSKTIDWTKPVRAVNPSGYLHINTDVAPRYLGSFVNILHQTWHVVIATMTDGTERCFYVEDNGNTPNAGLSFENYAPDQKLFAVIYKDRYDDFVRIYCSKRNREQAEEMIPDATRYGTVIGIQEVIIPGAMIDAAT